MTVPVQPVFYQEISVMPLHPTQPLVEPARCRGGTPLQRWLADGRQAEAQHLQRLQPLCGHAPQAGAGSRRRAQQAIRRYTVACYHDLAEHGYTLAQSALLLNLAPRTLRSWANRLRCPETLAVVPLGRPCTAIRGDTAQQVQQFLDLQGLGTGVPTLRQHFPHVPRAALTHLRDGYRQDCLADRAQPARRLHWLVAGRVWAIDFAAPSRVGQGGVLPPLDGVYPYILAVRDLASGYQLCWLPVSTASADTVIRVLARLFRLHGTPLVLKADNGPPFRAHQTQDFVRRLGIAFLFSPRYWPGYNGAIEAAIGSLKTRTERHAAWHGHGGYWTSVDLATACWQANHSTPRRLRGRTPDEVWTQQTRVSDVERVRFELAVERHRYRARHELWADPEQPLDQWQESKVDRKALERALVEHDYLLFRGRRVPLTIQAGKVTFFV